MGKGIRILCKRCWQVVSVPLREVTDYDLLNMEDQEPLLPVGCYFASDLIVPEELCFDAQPKELLVGRESLIDLVEGGPRVGCCGPSDGDWNLFCAKNHRIGIEMGDCYMPHFVRVPLHRVKIVEVNVEA